MEPRNIRECVLYTQDGKIFNGFEPINIEYNEDDIKHIHERVPIEVRQPSTITIPLRDVTINKKIMKRLELYYRARKYLHYLKHSKKFRTRLKYAKKLHGLYIQETAMQISRRRMRKMDESKVKIIEFDKYCGICEFENRYSTETPCDECLTYGAIKESHKPMRFIKKGGSKNEKID